VLGQQAIDGRHDAALHEDEVMTATRCCGSTLPASEVSAPFGMVHGDRAKAHVRTNPASTAGCRASGSPGSPVARRRRSRAADIQ
jgi:hypothetical protein